MHPPFSALRSCSCIICAVGGGFVVNTVLKRGYFDDRTGHCPSCVLIPHVSYDLSVVIASPGTWDGYSYVVEWRIMILGFAVLSSINSEDGEVWEVTAQQHSHGTHLWSPLAALRTVPWLFVVIRCDCNHRTGSRLQHDPLATCLTSHPTEKRKDPTTFART